MSYFSTVIFVVCIVSTIFGVLSIWTVGLGRKQLLCRKQICGLSPGKMTHLLETLLEDIPQVIITAIISHRLASLSPTAVFNLTTSGFNFVLNFLDIFEPESLSQPSSEQ